MRYKNPSVAAGIGLREEAVHPGSGLRVGHMSACLTSSAGAFHGGAPFAAAVATMTTANTGVWASIVPNPNTWMGNLPVPMTPSIAWQQLAPATTMKIQFRISGYDQFGMRQIEVTPIIEVSGLDTATFADNIGWIYASKVFSYVDNIEVRGENLNQTGQFFFVCGYSLVIDAGVLATRGVINAAAANWFGTGVASVINFFDTHKNWGIGTPVRVSAQVSDPVAAVYSTGVLTSSGTRVAAETVTIGTVTYTFRAALSATAQNEVLIGGSEAATLQNLFDAINRTGLPGTQYSALQSIHPQVRASAVTATTVTITAREAGSNANAIATTETGANLAWGAALMSGGYDSSWSRYPELLGSTGILLRQKTTPTVINTAARFKNFGTQGVLTGAALGSSAPPISGGAGNGVTFSYGTWEGTPHKWGFKSSDLFATSPFKLSGSSLRVNETPVAGQIEEDEFFFAFTVRSRLGLADSTSRRSGA